MRLETRIKTTKEQLFNMFDQVMLMEHYLGHKVTNKLIRSPLRNDKHPTCGFFVSKSGDLMFHDFSGDFTGNVIHVVMRIYGLTYSQAINKILNDFSSKNLEPVVIKKSISELKQELGSCKIKIKRRDWNPKDLEFWNKFGISLDILNLYNVYPAEIIFIDNRTYPIYINSANNPAYVYDFGNDKYKIYLPYKKTYRFICNTNVIQGMNQLTDGDYVVITKSLKDVMSLRALDVNAIAPQSESMVIDKSVMSHLKSKYNKIILNYDWDRAGCRSMIKMRKMYDDIIICSFKNDTKDISDYIAKYGLNKAKELKWRIETELLGITMNGK